VLTKAVTIPARLIDTIIAYVVCLAAVFALNTWNAVFQSIPAQLAFDLLLVSLFFGIWAMGFFARVSGEAEKIFYLYRVIAFPTALLLSVVATTAMTKITGLLINLSPIVKALLLMALL